MENSKEETKKQRICELDIREADKMLLTICLKPRKTAEICAKLNLAYSTVNQRILVLTALGYVKRIDTISGKKMLKTIDSLEP